MVTSTGTLVLPEGLAKVPGLSSALLTEVNSLGNTSASDRGAESKPPSAVAGTFGAAAEVASPAGPEAAAPDTAAAAEAAAT